MSRRFKKVDYDQALDLTVRLGDCLPNELSNARRYHHENAISRYPDEAFRMKWR